MAQKKALIAMSGGVDSSVAALLMQQGGFDCSGAMMLLCGENTTADADAVCRRLGIPFHVLDMRTQFRTLVQVPFAAWYEAGLTPNPCIICNRQLKFGAFLDAALDMGFDCIATGHYAVIGQENGRYVLKKAADPQKDQSYFLYGLTQQQLAHVHFPLGGYSKEEARRIADDNHFINAKKKDSQDICFVPDGDYVAFLKEFTGKDYLPGDYLDKNGNVVGRHNGAICYTRGQRKGLHLALGRPVYVCSKDMERNTVTVGDDDALYSTTLWADDINFVALPALDAPIRCKAKARSRMTEQPATVYPEADGRLRIVFDAPQRAITTGQAVVLYEGDTVLAGGTICQIQ